MLRVPHGAGALRAEPRPLAWGRRPLRPRPSARAPRRPRLQPVPTTQAQDQSVSTYDSTGIGGIYWDVTVSDGDVFDN